MDNERATPLTADDRPFGVVLSAASGRGVTDELCDRIAQMFATSTRPARVTIVRYGTELQRAIHETLESGVQALVVGGGDGSISLAAGVLAGGDVPLGILPMGTLNHFARDLGIPLSIEHAVNVILAGHVSRVDAGEVNGRVFVNNSSVGLYSRMVRLRERERAHGVRKWLAALRATIQVLAQPSRMAVRLTVDGEPGLYRTPLVMIANNEYRMEGLDAASRLSLVAGKLIVYVVKARHAREILRLIWLSLRGFPLEEGLLEVRSAEAVTIELRRQHATVALDGELVTMRTPLEYRIRPGGVAVFTSLDAGA
jgi:diacylglycerol kinase family enzyme